MNKVIFLAFAFFSFGSEACRIKYLDFPAAKKQASENYTLHKNIIIKKFDDADLVFSALVAEQALEDEVTSKGRYYVYKYAFNNIKLFKGSRVPKELIVKEFEHEPIEISCGVTKSELNETYLSDDRYYLIYMKNGKVIRATHVSNFVDRVSSVEELNMANKGLKSDS
ncbi:hypothetical protein L1286_16970 [Pseudoalteromonas sp. SMS1]|uniref:hypothetical protein n=1 Tax=Pseudoalteromonas sp. SMS1 TaxID=2908894 RepID=UPI001F23E48B|nr:hypothetical protein [Pseudoalteromonas sp. SMS1]MCF2859178.1 hypothetical protein [Pseudoalteromonas sp. SMS1]